MKQVIKKSIKKLIFLIYKIFSSLFYEGIDLGSGNRFSGFFCKGIDQINGQKLDKRSKLNLKKNLKYVYSSHFVEHISDETFVNLMSQLHNNLKLGGVIRISTPNFEKIKKILADRDFDFIQKNFGGLDVGKEWKKNGIEKNLENWALNVFANYQNYPYLNSPEFGFHHNDFYRGPPKIDSELVYKNSKLMNIEEFSKWAISHVPREHLDNGGHINFWNFEKINRLLKPLGFSCRECAYKKSKLKKLNYLDKLRGRVAISSYYECIKI